MKEISKRELKRSIFRMHNHGHSPEVIADKLNLDLQYVIKMISQYEENKK